ncbi:G protein-activated inward rectifier potassium channel 2 [Phytophthora boehmeriae]|uniref:G protein-activated inward rectifier potassium channel 2 n=1 Tax=Phytophthora boehmeriae TaxID=109152 RepID=A0A8T1X4N0_9STRA|nr:G protein-activated inward rectifier potassium channel 2 [Phytophthora boehmeriae]
MPASKKRIQNRGPVNVGTQQVPAALRDWVHIWHGVRVNNGAEDTSIFHTGSRIEDMPFWKQFIRLPSNSLFPKVFSTANPRKPYKDFLYVLLNMRWPMLLAVLLGVFLVNIFFFAAVACFVCGEPTNFFEAFDLSYQTFTTIGFGVVYPMDTCANVTMSVESFASMMVVSAITGLVFAKFAKPQAKVAFSKVCVVQPYGKKYLALVVRVANATQSRDVTHDVIMEAVFKVNLLRVEHKTKHVRDHDDEVLEKRRLSRGASIMTMEHGEDILDETSYSRTKVLSSYNLKLLQNNFITFRMGVAVVHIIDESSPLYGMSKNDIALSDMLIEVAMSGVDSTLQDTVSERYIYTADNVMWGYRFAELLEFNEKNAEVIMNFAKLSAVDYAPINEARYLKPKLTTGILCDNYETAESGYTHDVARPRSHRKSRSALHVGWPKIIFVFVLAFVLINFIFGLLYWLHMGGVSSYSDENVSQFELAFYMSVHTLATIGYGSIAPKPRSIYLNIVVFIESMVGIITVTIITGIAWSKFARPRAHIHFSSKMTIATIYGHRCLVFRAANTRHSGEVHENFFRIGVILTNRRTGLRQMYDVPLVTAEWPSIKLPATLIHVINENSPFYKFHSMKELSQSRVAVIALLTGLDTTFSENVYARKMYFWDDFAYDMRFEDFAVIERDRVFVDYDRFDRLVPEDRDEQVMTTPVLSVRSSVAGDLV